MKCSCKSRRYWRVTQFLCNHSAFNGYRQTPSRYSGLRCLRCGNFWRTRRPYVLITEMAEGDEATRPNDPTLPL